MKKSTKVLLIVFLAILVLTSVVLFFNNFKLFPKEEKFLDKCVTSDGVLIEAYHVKAGATANEVVQIKKKVGNNYTLLKAFENKNEAELHLIDDTTLKIVLRFTQEGRPDTVLLNIR